MNKAFGNLWHHTAKAVPSISEMTGTTSTIKVGPNKLDRCDSVAEATTKHFKRVMGGRLLQSGFPSGEVSMN